MRSRGHEVPYDARDVFDGLRERGRRGGGFGLSVWCLSFSDSLSVPTSFRHGMETRAVLGGMSVCQRACRKPGDVVPCCHAKKKFLSTTTHGHQSIIH
uniref:Uncharacterized protein n=1 Tax=Oryza barthii TaxID=65489 RepID=A0A0D3GRS1_9ORYZ